MPHDLSIVVF